jgi:DNA-binding NarL/FixJ family response regulator
MIQSHQGHRLATVPGVGRTVRAGGTELNKPDSSVNVQRDHAPPAPGSLSTELSILIVDDSRLYRESLAGILADQPGVLSVSTAHGLESLQAQLDCGRPDVVLLNLASVKSRSLVRAVRERNCTTRLIVLGVNEDDDHEILQCAEAGVSGYLSRSDSLPHLLELICRVTSGETLFSPRIAAVLLRGLADRGTGRQQSPRLPTLTDRENQILRLLERGRTNREIAEELSIEVFTVKNHVHSVLTKLGVRRRGEAAAVIRGLGGLAPEGFRGTTPAAPER